jgi:putative transposase
MLLHNRKSIRLKGFDYSTRGMYFITIDVQDHDCLFGDIRNGIFIPNQAGVMVERYWNQLNRNLKMFNWTNL